METSPPFFALPGLFRSYRTYEEWKLENDFILTPFKFRSYRTYEEWKRLCLIKCSKSEYWFLPYLWGMETNVYLFRSKRFLTRSYRTYEEWKLSHLKQIRQPNRVLTVPMRNGNFAFMCDHPEARTVLTVPMRNGNDWRIDIISSEEGFLPYLWGMETMNGAANQGTFVSSYRTFEEWKHESLLTLTEKWHIKKFNCRFMRVYDTKF